MFFSWILFASSFLFFTLSIKWLRRVLGNKAERAGGSREHKKPADGKGQMYHSILSCKHGKAGGNEKRERERHCCSSWRSCWLCVSAQSRRPSLFSHIQQKCHPPFSMHFHTLTRDQSPKPFAGLKKMDGFSP